MKSQDGERSRYSERESLKTDFMRRVCATLSQDSLKMKQELSAAGLCGVEETAVETRV